MSTIGFSWERKTWPSTLQSWTLRTFFAQSVTNSDPQDRRPSIWEHLIAWKFLNQRTCGQLFWEFFLDWSAYVWPSTSPLSISHPPPPSPPPPSPPPKDRIRKKDPRKPWSSMLATLSAKQITYEENILNIQLLILWRFKATVTRLLGYSTAIRLVETILDNILKNLSDIKLEACVNIVCLIFFYNV